MHPVLQASADIYAETLRSNEPNKWLDYVDSILHGITASDIAAIFEEARTMRADSVEAQRHLWIFQHPTLEVFRAVIIDPDMCQGFAALLEVAHGKRPHVIKRKARRYLPRFLLGLQSEWELIDTRLSHVNWWRVNPVREADWFLLNYARLLERKGYSHFHLRRDVLELLPEPEIEEESRNRIKKKLQRTYAYEWLQSHRRELPYHFLHCKELRRSHSQLVDSLSELVDVGYDKVKWADLPWQWKPIGTLWRVLLQSISLGAWPTFHLCERTVQRAKCALDPSASYKDKEMTDTVHSFLEKSDDWTSEIRRVTDGRLPVGLKLHGASGEAILRHFSDSAFRLESAGKTTIMPPVGNAAVLKDVFLLIEKRCGVIALDSDVQIQVCSAGELDQRNAALLGICFYLGSDRIRRYRREDFTTTHVSTCGRLVVYGAGGLDRGFDWWDKDDEGRLVIRKLPGKIINRTDVLTCKSVRDIENVNLVATLLMHAQCAGYWEALGKSFIKEVEGLLEQHGLSGLLAVSWVYGGSAHTPAFRDAGNSDEDVKGTLFFDVFSDLMEYAFAEVARIQKAKLLGKRDADREGILSQMREILLRYGAELHKRAKEVRP